MEKQFKDAMPKKDEISIIIIDNVEAGLKYDQIMVKKNKSNISQIIKIKLIFKLLKKKFSLIFLFFKLVYKILSVNFCKPNVSIL